MDLSLASTEDLVKELTKRFGVQVILCMDTVAAQEYFEGVNDTQGPERLS